MTISVVNDEIFDEINGELRTAILGCECCAFPLVDGIPVFLANDCTREALHALDANDIGRARQILLGLDGPCQPSPMATGNPHIGNFLGSSRTMLKQTISCTDFQTQRIEAPMQ